MLVRALAEIPDAQLVVAGDPLDPVEPLQELAREVGVADRITWRLGYLPDAEVETLMREATLTVFPYPGGESASGALATALGHGRPAVVTEVLGETVREFGAGAVVPPNDPGALAEAINGAPRTTRGRSRRPSAAPSGPAQPFPGARSPRLTNGSTPTSLGKVAR